MKEVRISTTTIIIIIIIIIITTTTMWVPVEKIRKGRLTF
jgi:hypothetical protein